MNSPQAQAENDRPYWAEDEMTESERREFEQWLDAVYWQTRAAEAMEEGAF